MAKIINLRQLRKQRVRDDRRAEAGAKAARSTEPKALQKARKAEAERAARMLEGHRRDNVQAEIGLTPDD